MSRYTLLALEGWGSTIAEAALATAGLAQQLRAQAEAQAQTDPTAAAVLPAHAARYEGQDFPDSLQLGGSTLTTTGAGTIGIYGDTYGGGNGSYNGVTFNGGTTVQSNSGTITMEGNTISWTKDDNNIYLSVTDLAGNTTQLTVPLGSFTFGVGTP